MTTKYTSYSFAEVKDALRLHIVNREHCYGMNEEEIIAIHNIHPLILQMFDDGVLRVEIRNESGILESIISNTKTWKEYPGFKISDASDNAKNSIIVDAIVNSLSQRLELAKLHFNLDDQSLIELIKGDKNKFAKLFTASLKESLTEFNINPSKAAKILKSKSDMITLFELFQPNDLNSKV